MRSSDSSPSSAYKGTLSFLLFVSVILNIYAVSRWTSLKLTQVSAPVEKVATGISSPSAAPENLEEVSVRADSVTAPQEKNLHPETLQLENSALDGPPKYGHLPYAEANPEDLIIVSSFGLGDNQRFEKLHPAAAAALMQMSNAARDEGVWIVLLSGFREYDKQEELFAAQIQRRGTPEEAAKSSAPAGHSEHHTGFAMDLGDGHMPSADINQGFANTEAFVWLLQNGTEFGFELSFPANNTQGVNYEPWHWRFTGDSETQEIFRRAK